MSQELLEVLIGKFLDGEITPAEKKMLDEQLACDESAGRLFEQLQRLHQKMQQAADVQLSTGRSAEEIFDRAWIQSKYSIGERAIRFLQRMRFVTGMAAGLLLGLGVHFVLERVQEEPLSVDTIQTIADANPTEIMGQTDGLPAWETSSVQPVTRRVDWYNFTDSSGNEWVVEGYRYREKPNLINCGL
ncbi:MAG: hypothetical protein JXA82_08115 [Sedimentisphaerales bacterium]|nr:hypothetical protein [Sedimentisphaerales bacterium]